ncbi:gap junction gamma-1 protein [Polyodon spathula]|uniref:gap junction gamma-1 protein n=1 Tax=Polyodon spathula TaxID=7913 RepID=UPI001B7E0541|nr:gap junction gamma-1 protein [Polyodon spathula]
MGDWSILGRFLTEVQNHSTVIGKIWLTMLLIFRILLVTLVGDAVYSDEQSKFTCNTLQPGCNNVCYDTFAPVSHLRFWVFQIILVSTPSIFYIVYVLHKIAKDKSLELQEARKQLLHKALPPQVEQHEEDMSSSERADYHSEGLTQGSEPAQQTLLDEEIREVSKDPTKLSRKVLLIYIVHVILRSLMEVGFLVGQYHLFGFKVPHLFLCVTHPCPNTTDCFVSRATEKTIFLNFMFGVSLGCFLLNLVELHYLGWLYIFRVLCSACCESEKREHTNQHPEHNPLLLQLKESLQEQLVLGTAPGLSQEKPRYLPSHPTTISLEMDSTLEYTSKKSPEDEEHAKPKLAKLGKSKKSWL